MWTAKNGSWTLNNACCMARPSHKHLEREQRLNVVKNRAKRYAATGQEKAAAKVAKWHLRQLAYMRGEGPRPCL